MIKNLSAFRQGVAQTFICNTIWGNLPYFFLLLAGFSPFLIIGYRIIFAFITLLVVLIYTGKWRDVLALRNNLKLIGWLCVTALLIGLNWFLFIYAMLTNRVLDASLGYLILPLISTLLGGLILKEKFNAYKILAFALAFFAVSIMVFVYGEIPYLGLSLGLSFSLYGFFRKQIQVSTLIGLSVEVAILVPVGIYLMWEFSDGTGIPNMGSVYMMLLGPITVLTLLAYASSIKKLPFSFAGILFYWNPLLQMIGGLVLGETMTPARGIGFSLIWCSLFLFSYGQIRQNKLITRPVPL